MPKVGQRQTLLLKEIIDGNRHSMIPGLDDQGEVVAPSSLPEPVRRYAEQVLPSGLGTGRTVRIAQVGEMTLRPGSKPRRFTATEDFAIDRVEFTWRARFPMLGPVSLRVTDSYYAARGSLQVRLLGLPLQRHQGADLAQGEAFRYLAEIPWTPHAILANRELAWRELDDHCAEVSTCVGDQRIALRLVFNEADEIVHAIAERPRRETGEIVMPWIGDYREYKLLGDVRVPSHGEVRWELPEGPFTYWRGTITSLERHH